MYTHTTTTAARASSSTGSTPGALSPALLWGGGTCLHPDTPSAGQRAILTLTFSELPISKTRDSHSGETQCGSLVSARESACWGLGKFRGERGQPQVGQIKYS